MITIEEFKKKQSETSRLIGLDLGSKRIGVSICDEKQSIATPFKTINKTNNDNLINELKKIIDERFFNLKQKFKNHKLLNKFSFNEIIIIGMLTYKCSHLVDSKPPINQ